MDNDLREYLETWSAAWEGYVKKRKRLDELEMTLSNVRQGNWVLSDTYKIEIQSEQELIALIHMNTRELEEMEESIKDLYVTQ